MNEYTSKNLSKEQVRPASLPIHQKIQSNNNLSSLVDEYCRLLSRFAFEPVDQASLAASLLSEGIKYSREHSHDMLQIAIEEYSSNYEAIKINVSYGFFCTFLYLINVDAEKTFSNSSESFAGAFGRVQKCFVDGVPFAVKSVKFEDDSFAQVFRQVVKECFLLKIASALQVGPNAKSIFGFDIVVYRNCLDFGMQFCQPASLNDDQHTLKRSLSILHHFNIVHMDIKPQNIAFSYHHEKLVFIDFGLSKAIKEEIGHKSYTNFIGSFIYCSSQMLSLYTNSDFGLVDLYHNDAHCLDLSLQKIKKIEHVADQPQLLDQNNYISSSQMVLKQKFILFVLGSDSIFSSINLGLIVSKMSKSNLLGFILTLPQRVNIISYYKQLMRDTEESNDKLNSLYRNYATEHQNHYQVFKDRFLKISHMGKEIYTSEKVENGFQRLFDKEMTAQYKLQVYSLALIKFIKINSHHRSFEQKITACKVFSEHYLKNQIAEQSISLYRKVVGFIFKLSIKSSQPQRYQILRESLQTVAVLEIVSQDSFIEAYFAVFDWKLTILPKIRLVFQFLTTLQFVRQKYRKTYNDERLLQIFIQKLKTFIEELATQGFDQQQKMIISDITTMINFRLIQNMQNVDNFLKQESRYLSIQAKRLKKEIELYLASYIILTDIDKFNAYVQKYYKIILARVLYHRSYSTRFIYGQLTLYHVYCCTDQLPNTEQIYDNFFRQFSPHQQLTYFRIYYFHRINTIKQKLSLISLSQRKEYQNALPNIAEPQLKYHQIFDILNWLINNTDNFHYMLRYFFLNISYIELNNSSERMCSFIKDNLYKIIRLTNKYHQANQKHRNNLKIQITLFISIIEYVTKYEKYQQYNQQSVLYQRIKMEVYKCCNSISQLQCFECKFLALYSLDNFFNYTIGLSAESQQNLLKTVDALVLVLKNRELKQNIFPLMVMLIRASLVNSQLRHKYDPIVLFYEYVRQFKRYHNVLLSIRQCNLFLNVYTMIYQKFPPDQLITFIYLLCKSIGQRYSNISIDNFYYSLVYVVQIANRQQSEAQSFKQFHDFIVRGLLYCLKGAKNAYVAVYFSALLELHLISGIQDKMLKFVSISLNSLKPFAKVIILNHYYSHHESYLPATRRKKYSLIIKHLKNCYDIISTKQILKHKLKVKMTRNQQNHTKYAKLKKQVERYHQNLQNIHS